MVSRNSGRLLGLCVVVTCTATTSAAWAGPASVPVLTVGSNHGPGVKVTWTIPGITGVNSVGLANTPLFTINDSTLLATVSTPVVSLSLKTLLGNVICTYSGGSVITGTAAPSPIIVTFTNQPFTKSAGPAVCPSSGTISAKVGPFLDTNQGSLATYLN